MQAYQTHFFNIYVLYLGKCCLPMGKNIPSTQRFAVVVPGYWTALLLHLECIIILWFYIILNLNI